MFDSHLFIPHWIIAGIEESIEQKSLRSRLSRNMVTPFFDVWEWKIVTIVVSHLQSLILEQKEYVLKLDELEKTFPFVGRTKQLHVPDLFAKFINIKIKFFDQKRYQLLSEDFWDEKNNTCVLHFKLDDFQEELILGKVSYYDQLLRSAPVPKDYAQNSYTMDKALFLDLKDYELALVQKILKCMFLNKDYLHIEGVFGTPLSSLMGGLSHGNLDRFISFGKKLYEHGYFASVSKLEKLLFTQTNSDLFLWKKKDIELEISKQKELNTKTNIFFNQRFLRNKFLAFCDKLDLRHNAPLRTQLEELVKVILESDRVLESYIPLENGSFLSSCLFFLELVIRFEKNPHSFPKDWTVLPIFTILKNSGSLNEKLEEFIEELELRSSEYSNMIQEISVVFGKTEQSRAGFVTRSKGIEISKNYLKTPIVIKSKIEVRKILENMRNNAHNQYKKLADDYLLSLDDHSKKIVLSIQQKMQPNVFHMHLESRLVQYVLENPQMIHSEESPLH